MKLPFPRRFKAWLVAVASLTAVTGILVAPMTRPRAAVSTTYTFTDLGTLGGVYSRALGINNCGQVVGESSVTGASPTHPFIWRDLNGNLLSDPGEMKDLGTLGGTRGLAADINASGLVVGTSTIASSEERAFRWFDLDGDGTPDPGEMIDLGVLPNHSTHNALGVNDIGQIVGSAEDTNLVTSGFIWNASTGLQFIPALNAVAPSHGYAINNSSNIAGYSADLNKAFVFNGTTNVNLGTFGGPRSIAYDINAAGHAVGFADVDNSSGSPPSHAFKWNGTALQDLTVLTGGVRSQAYSINSSGTIVGYSEVTGGALHAFVHDGTQMYDLNSLMTNPPVGWTLTQARGINDGGQIVGYGVVGGETHAFLLTPTGFTTSCSPTVTVAVSPASVSEDGPTNLTYTFTRAPVTNTAVTVTFLTSGSAAPPVDYAVSGSGVTYDPNVGLGTVAFAAGEVTKSVTVDPAADSVVETNETVVLTAVAGSGYIVGTMNAASGIINNDDTSPGVSVTVSPSATAEDGATNLTYTFTRSSTAGPLTANFSVGGTANASTDYAQTGAATFTPPTGTVTFADGIGIATVTVNPSTDSTVELDESVILTVTTGSGYTVGGPSVASGTISNDDTDVTVTLVSSVVSESGFSNLIYTFTRNGVTTGALTVNFSVGGTATLGNDYTQSGAATFSSSSGTVTIGDTNSSETITINPSTDSVLEGDETVILTVTGGAYNIANPNSQTGTITPDAPAIILETPSLACPLGNCAAAVDSVTFARGPFRLTNVTNFSTDQLTRVILFTSPLGMTDADLATPNLLSVHINGYANPLPIEHVGPITGVTGLSGSYIIVRLPADLSTLNPSPGPNFLSLTVKQGSATSNQGLFTITP